jgi:hypothetical protein
MRLTHRLTTLAIAAVAVTGALGAQARGESRGSRGSSRGGGAPRASSAPRMSMQRFAPSRSFAPRSAAPMRAAPVRSAPMRSSPMRSAPVRSAPLRPAPNEFRGTNGFRGAAPAGGGRPLITRASAEGRAFGRDGHGFAREGRAWEHAGAFRDGRWIGGREYWFRSDLPWGWRSSVVFGGFFPLAWAPYCETVPYEFDYMMPPMSPGYDPCLFGDRIIVFDRFSRHISFVAVL